MDTYRSITPLVAIATIAACSGKTRDPHVFLLNGLDIPVSITIDGDGGKQTIDVPARGRATPEVSGLAKVKVTSAKGELISESQAQFGKRGGSPGCFRIFNVVGAAAYVNEEVAYGTGFGTPQYYRRAGDVTEDECYVSFPFVDPPKLITVDKFGPAGANRSWLHYEGDGSWVAAVGSLLDDTGQYASQSRGAAQRIVRAVVTHDPTNAALPAIKARLTQMNLAFPEPSPGNLLGK